MIDRQDIIAAWLADRSIQQADATVAFQRLAERQPGLTTADIIAAADEAKEISRALRSVAHWVERFAERERRRNQR